MKNYFEKGEFYKRRFFVSQAIIDKIKFIISILTPLRVKLDSPIYISKKSGFRPVWWERLMKRSGNSEHCFKGKGAVDLTCSPEKFQELYRLLVEESSFTRICLYPDKMFIHCDFKESSHRTYLDTGNGWERV